VPARLLMQPHTSTARALAGEFLERDAVDRKVYRYLA
jgi:hypothetical protein